MSVLASMFSLQLFSVSSVFSRSMFFQLSSRRIGGSFLSPTASIMSPDLSIEYTKLPDFPLFPITFCSWFSNDNGWVGRDGSHFFWRSGLVCDLKYMSIMGILLLITFGLAISNLESPSNVNYPRRF